VQKTLTVLKSALQQAIRDGALTVNPAAGVRPPRGERDELHVPTSEQLRKLLEAAVGTPYEMPLLLAATTGMRRGEILGLRWRAVVLEAAELHVTTTLQRVRGETVFVPPKTDRSRRKISLPPVTVDALKRHRKAQTERRLFIGAVWTDLDLVVDRGDGEHMDPDTLSAGFRRAAGVAGIDGARLHDLRHAYATTLLAAGVNVIGIVGISVGFDEPKPRSSSDGAGDPS
jgi:integrase